MPGSPALAPLTVVVGADRALTAAALSETVAALTGPGGIDPMEVVRLLEGATMADIAGAARTVPLFDDRRVVVVEAAHTLSKEDLAALVTYLRDPEPSTLMVLSWGTDRLPAALTELVNAGGMLINRATASTASARASQAGAIIAASPVALDGPAKAALIEHVGADLGRLTGTLELLAATFGPGVRLGVEQVAPLLGTPGAIPPWELTDAVDAGDIPRALGLLGRLLDTGSAPIQLHAILANHYERLWRLSAAGITTEAAGADLLGVKGSTFPVRKALTLSRRVPLPTVVRLVSLTAAAGHDLRGGSALPPRLVLEVLISRLGAHLGSDRTARR